MSRTVATSDAWGVIIANQHNLTHAEFRLLFALSDCPAGGAFRVPATRILRNHRFSRAELVTVAASLSVQRDIFGTITVDHESDAVVWTLP